MARGEMKELVVTAIHSVRRPANRRHFLTVKQETERSTPSRKGGLMPELSDEALGKVQTVLDTPVENEDARWGQIQRALGDDPAQEECFRSGLRLLTAVAKEADDGLLDEVLREAGLIAKAEKPPEGEKGPKGPIIKERDKPAQLPAEFVELLKSAGVENAAEVFKGLAADPAAASAIMPVVGVLAAAVKSLRGELEKTQKEKRRERVQKMVSDIGMAGKEADGLSGLLADSELDDAAVEKLAKALEPAGKLIKEARKQLLQVSGTESRDDSTGQSALDRATAIAKQRVTKGEAEDMDKAIADVFRDTPGLYAQHRAESLGAAPAAEGGAE